MHIGVLTTSWPSEARPWAGHFVRDQAEQLARLGCRVSVVAPSWRAHGTLWSDGFAETLSAPVGGTPGPLKGHRGLRALAAMTRVASGVRPDVWLCHWWPTVLAAPRGARRIAVIHGTDMDLLETLPRPLVVWLAHSCEVVAVSSVLADRFTALCGGPEPLVHGIGARAADSDDRAAVGPDWWRSAPGPRVLTVGRDHPGKGLDIAREAARRSNDLAWLLVHPGMGIGPAGIRTLIEGADLVVVPSRGGPDFPGEGRPHVIAQATVAGVPMVGGPNPAVRSAMRDLGQVEVSAPGALALREAVERALRGVDTLRMALEVHRPRWTWESLVGEQWLPTLERAAGSQR